MAQIIPAHSLRERKEDAVFGITAKANEAIARYGSENIINSTIGTLLRDDGEIVALKSVYDVYRNLPDKFLAGYAAIEGEADFLQNVPAACFGEYIPEGYIRSVATPGGTGAVRHAVYNYLNRGDTFASADWYWPAYGNIAAEYDREFRVFELFDEAGCFNIASFRGECENMITKQHRILAVINSPSNNPTGYSLSGQEWDEVIDTAKFYAKNSENTVILLMDIAYIDFAGENSRAFMRKFSNLPKNILSLFAFSQSKSMTMYGLRSGALIAVSSDKETVEDFFYSCKFSNRATWSNGAKGAMKTLALIYSDPVLLKAYRSELDYYRGMLKERGDVFFARARENSLPMTTYRDGFFVSIRSEDPVALSDRLCENNLFTVPFQKGIRVALCSISKEKCALAADLIARHL